MGTTPAAVANVPQGTNSFFGVLSPTTIIFAGQLNGPQIVQGTIPGGRTVSSLSGPYIEMAATYVTANDGTIWKFIVAQDNSLAIHTAWTQVTFS